MTTKPDEGYNTNHRQREEVVLAVLETLQSHSADIKDGFNHFDVRHILLSATISAMSSYYCEEHMPHMVNEHLLETWQIMQRAMGVNFETMHPVNRLGRFCNDMFETAVIYEDLDQAMAYHAAERLFTSIIMGLSPVGHRASTADLMLQHIKKLIAMAEAEEKAMGAVMPEGAVN